MEVRPYAPADRGACLAVFDSNVPEFFRSEERREFEDFLTAPKCPYFVMELAEGIAGCGGYCLTEEQTAARMVWGMVRRELHRKGLGRFLLLYRLHEIGALAGVQLVQLDTSQAAAPFFASQGFKVTGVVKDGYGAGLDRVSMTMKLTVCP
ncbi:MAG TPA: GNAT family N-acetyltransferase [Bryobacteraceae bacterium]|jgi:hypothetical protein